MNYYPHRKITVARESRVYELYDIFTLHISFFQFPFNLPIDSQALKCIILLTRY